MGFDCTEMAPVALRDSFFVSGIGVVDAIDDPAGN
jgi:hypothetical protein